MLADLKEHLTDFVNGKFPAPPFGDHHGIGTASAAERSSGRRRRDGPLKPSS